MEVKPYVLLGCIDVYEDYRVDLPQDQLAKTLDELVCPLQSNPPGLYRHRGYLGFTHGRLHVEGINMPIHYSKHGGHAMIPEASFLKTGSLIHPMLGKWPI